MPMRRERGTPRWRLWLILMYTWWQCCCCCCVDIVVKFSGLIWIDMCNDNEEIQKMPFLWIGVMQRCRSRSSISCFHTVKPRRRTALQDWVQQVQVVEDNVQQVAWRVFGLQNKCIFMTIISNKQRRRKFAGRIWSKNKSCCKLATSLGSVLNKTKVPI